MKSLLDLDNVDDIAYQACMHGGKRPTWQRLRSYPHAAFHALERVCDNSHVHESWGARATFGFTTEEERAFPHLFCERLALAAKGAAMMQGKWDQTSTMLPSQGQGAHTVSGENPAAAHDLWRARLRANAAIQSRRPAFPALLPEFRQVLTVPVDREAFHRVQALRAIAGSRVHAETSISGQLLPASSKILEVNLFKVGHPGPPKDIVGDIRGEDAVLSEIDNMLDLPTQPNEIVNIAAPAQHGCESPHGFGTVRGAPTRACLADFRPPRLPRDHLYVGRSFRRRGWMLSGSYWANPFHLSQHTRGEAVDKFEGHARSLPHLQERLNELAGKVLVCHCRGPQRCHADVINTMFKEFVQVPSQDDGGSDGAAAFPTKEAVKHAAKPDRAEGALAGHPDRAEGAFAGKDRGEEATAVVKGPTVGVARVGVAWGVTDFTEAALQATHPFEELTCEDYHLKAIFYTMTRGPAAVQAHRKDRLEYWSRRAKALGPREAELHAAAHEDVRGALEGKRVLLLAEMLRSVGYARGNELAHTMLAGFPVLGKVPSTDLFEPKHSPAQMGLEDLWRTARLKQDALLEKRGPSGDHQLDAEVTKATLEEVTKGWLKGPYTPGELDSRYGLWVGARRFGVRQGDSVRPIGDYSEFDQNATVETAEKIDVWGGG